jgi:glycosyltransferase involved in cell wall biosynthesis
MKIALIDPSSRSLPYDYFFLNEISETLKIDFYCSFTAFNEEYLKEIEKNENISVLPYNISKKNRVQGALNYFLLLFKILLNKGKYEKIHFMWSILPALEYPFFLLFTKKFLFTFHNDVPHNYGKDTFWFYSFIFKISKTVIFVSQKVKNDFIINYKVKDKNKCLLIKHGIMSVEPKDSLDKIEYEGLEKKIIFWGNIKKYKGIDTFLHIAKSDYFKDFQISIYGKWDKELLPIKEELKNSQVNIFDYFLNTTELKALLHSNAIFILPYDKATQSGVLYTLLYYRRLFISTPTGDNGEFLKSAGLSSLMFDNRNISEIISTVEYCFNNEKEIVAKLDLQRNEYKWSNLFKEKEFIYK